MKIALLSIILIILQEIKHDGPGHVYKAVTTYGDTGTVFSISKLNQGDTITLK